MCLVVQCVVEVSCTWVGVSVHNSGIATVTPGYTRGYLFCPSSMFDSLL